VAEVRQPEGIHRRHLRLRRRLREELHQRRLRWNGRKEPPQRPVGNPPGGPRDPPNPGRPGPTSEN
jgi:hypothetical protein